MFTLCTTVYSRQANEKEHITDLPSIHLVHDDNKDKDFELEMTWVCAESGGKHKAVPQALLDEADAKGRAALEEGMEED